MRKLFRSVFRRRKRRLMRLLPTTQKPLKARNAPSALTHPVARQVAGAGGTVTGLREAVGPAAQYLMLVKLVANTRPTRRVEKPCTKLLKVSIAQKSGRGKKKEEEKRKKKGTRSAFSTVSLPHSNLTCLPCRAYYYTFFIWAFFYIYCLAESNHTCFKVMRLFTSW